MYNLLKQFVKDIEERNMGKQNISEYIGIFYRTALKS